ncbi:ABC transporter permease subunit [Candidatus Bathyarchaeota archaeon]|nr:ABC transporter permease subunit [Candidatus Bathyarchaeota archaeon]NIV43485.1 ABC transporter permease subunit [Candidatus Bathyarchaeota archaeon]
MRETKKFTILTQIVAWAVSLVWIIPFFGVFMASIRPLPEILNGWWNFEVFTPTFGGFLGAWNHPTAPLSRALLNSLIVTIPSTVIPIFVAALGAYSFARFRFPTRDLLFLTLVLLQTIPQQMVIIPIFNIMIDIGLWNNYIGLILVHSAFALPWQIFFLRNFFSVLPVEVEEAAMIDGASYFKIFYKIVLPLTLPALASLTALQFVWVWNDFFFATVLISSPSLKLATQAIPVIKGRLFIDWTVLSAASIIVMIIPIAIYVVLQRYYVRGIVAGAVKG